MDLIRILGHEFEVEVYGDGLLNWIMQHGAQLDIEREQNVGAASRTLREVLIYKTAGFSPTS